jgi:Bifunctional DNA primase/polymerase, N-terminal
MNSVIPTDRAVLLRPRSKAPATQTWPMNPRGSERHTREEIEEHDGNLGCICGKPSGSEFSLQVLDFDHKVGGLEALQALEKAHGRIPGARVRTGGGGLHIYLEGTAKEAKKRLTAPGTDLEFELQAEGSYVVAPFSVHPAGGVYEPERPELWTKHGWPVFPPAPKWLAELVLEHRATTPSGTSKGGLVFTADELAAGAQPGFPRRYAPVLTSSEVVDNRVLCPNHDDNAQSLYLNEDNVRCFVCGFNTKARGLAALVLGVGVQRGNRIDIGSSDREAADALWKQAIQ